MDIGDLHADQQGIIFHSDAHVLVRVLGPVPRTGRGRKPAGRNALVRLRLTTGATIEVPARRVIALLLQ